MYYDKFPTHIQIFMCISLCILCIKWQYFLWHHNLDSLILHELQKLSIRFMIDKSIRFMIDILVVLQPKCSTSLILSHLIFNLNFFKPGKHHHAFRCQGITTPTCEAEDELLSYITSAFHKDCQHLALCSVTSSFSSLFAIEFYSICDER